METRLVWIVAGIEWMAWMRGTEYLRLTSIVIHKSIKHKLTSNSTCSYHHLHCVSIHMVACSHSLLLKRRLVRRFSLRRDPSNMPSLTILPVEQGRVSGNTVLAPSQHLFSLKCIGSRSEGDLHPRRRRCRASSGHGIGCLERGRCGRRGTSGGSRTLLSCSQRCSG